MSAPKVLEINPLETELLYDLVCAAFGRYSSRDPRKSTVRQLHLRLLALKAAHAAANAAFIPTPYTAAPAAKDFD